MILENVTLAPLTYYKIGGPARYFARPRSVSELDEIHDFMKKHTALSVFILGAGSNILVPDKGYDGLVIRTDLLDKTIEQDDTVITVGASVPVIQLLRHCMQTGAAGLELLVGIPGTMGGVFCMNAGTKSGEIKERTIDLKVYSLKTRQTRTVSEPAYSYRKNHFLQQDEIILSGRLRITKGVAENVQNNITSLLESRKKSQPIDKPSCGSVFKNPQGQNAWKLIADAGLRGHRIGNAQISEMHTNFIVNLGGASSEDVRSLIQLAKARVKEKCGVELEEEVILL